MTILDENDMVDAAKKISGECGCAVLLKGGHSTSDANDLLCDGESIVWFHGKRIDNPNTHGTGCTLSSAIAANLAKGFTLSESVQRAKGYISQALAAQLDLGLGSGAMNHIFDLKSYFAEEKKEGSYTKSMLRKAMDRIKRILEIDDLHPHMFRYSHATVLHELGVDDKTIQHWEGHANQATTANIYIKNTQTMTDRAEAILSDFASANA